MNQHDQPSMNRHPIIVDFDYTVINSSYLSEAIISFLKQAPLSIFRLLGWRFKGISYFKSRLSSEIALNLETLPRNPDVDAYCSSAAADGHPIVLLTDVPSDQSEKLRALFPWIDRVESSQSSEATILKTYNSDIFGFVSGRTRNDLKWKSCNSGVMVARSAPRWARQHSSKFDLINSRRAPVHGFLKSLRMSHWIKNLLIFVPIIMAHQFDHAPTILRLAGAFLSFSGLASSIYILNDLWDLEDDRIHLHKKNRPLASAQISISSAISIVLILFTSSLIGAAVIGTGFLAVCLAYLTTNLLYSLKLKQVPIVDLFLLAGFYIMRLVAGACVAGVEFSNWLLIFSLFIFVSLGILKRYSEMKSLAIRGLNKSAGRGYLSTDLDALFTLGTATSLGAVIVLGLYIDQPKIDEIYPHVRGLWVLIGILAFWTMHIWFNAHRGKITEDPVQLIFRDPITILAVFAAAAAYIGAL